MPSSAELRVGGLARLSTCDWPGELAATIFCQGCPWSCPYCHNPHLLPVRGADELAWADVLAFLDGRRGLLDGVVFSGGEATLQAALPEAVREVRALGFRIGLHTAGPYPDRLGAVLPWVDWVGFDVKAPFAEYDRVSGVPGSGAKALESLRVVIASGVTVETRTTIDPAFLGDDSVARLQAELAAMGARPSVLQDCRPVPPRP